MIRMTSQPRQQPPTQTDRQRRSREKRRVRALSLEVHEDVLLAIEKAVATIVPQTTKKAIVELALRAWLEQKGWLERPPKKL